MDEVLNITLVGNNGTTKKKSGEADLDLTKKGLSIGQSLQEDGMVCGLPLKSEIR